MQKIDFLAVGDITVDSFIRMKDASVHCDLNREHCQICVRFGDKVPYEFLVDVPAVGNSPNAAVAAARLGLNSALATDLGTDEAGEECRAQLEKEHVNQTWVSSHEKLPTNHHFVLWYEDERTILVNHAAFPYKFPDAPEPRWMYVSSLGPDSQKYHQEIAAYLEAHPSVKLAFQPGTFQINFGMETMKKFYSRAEVIVANLNEAEKILKTKLVVRDSLEELKRLGSKMVLLTDSRNGSYLFDGQTSWHIPIYPDEKPPYERTGAGDATASTFVSALILGKTPAEAVRWGHTNSRSVVQEVGAQKGLLTREQLEKTLAEAPPEFIAERLA
ncbi:MAG: hypothetical protein A3H57_01640 [Candidatus Taylorbacteria bacterium RIFCSPLOWO2_02_FULL_43_11]|uniref:Carbohydrate kinase PfkB domain-containing protein n=1 Tax=Candidatus Taylorbacteria bacterium RIFCSPHIGHO2_02_FULL_46_13 TaxID=1802312 RepID=A0A1G2MRR5_9BACT|nr:MAG: hypothetical protein A3C06_03180 [Candidatus Taylorbacteria bacterium RIFCSPHIGHO2_02_FULL_46_13]OHA36765.1 MAG: hypothetical protein A3H57_01640 [Candidatus Taylorbacteria bacterium RIFCSPLOWO2_02_FULL_43_11]